MKPHLFHTDAILDDAPLKRALYTTCKCECARAELVESIHTYEARCLLYLDGGVNQQYMKSMG
jgi:hypothetical protein